MYNKLLLEFDNLLNDEAKRIATIIESLYKTITFEKIDLAKLVRKNIKQEFTYYWIDIEIRVFNLLFDNEKDYLKEKCDSEKNLKKYALWCKREMKSKDHLKGADRLAEIIIELYQQNDDIKINLITLLADNMNELFPEHNDCVDARTTILYLQKEIRKKGYIISSLSPFHLSKKTIKSYL